MMSMQVRSKLVSLALVNTDNVAPPVGLFIRARISATASAH